MSKIKVALVATHPIQYQAPWFRALAASPCLDLHVLFCHQATPLEQAAAGFGVQFEWDIPLLQGYSHTFMRNVAKNPTVGTFSGLDTPEIGRRIEAEKYDAVIVSGWYYKSAWQTFLACWHRGVPLLVRGDSHLYTNRSSTMKFVKEFSYRLFIPRFSACLAAGKWSREYFIHYGAAAHRVFFVPHSGDSRLFNVNHCTGQYRDQFRENWSLDKTATIFMFSGKFIERKRPMDFVNAIANANASNVPVVGIMIGDGPLRLQCEEYVNLYKLPVRFTGFLNQSQIPFAYHGADVLVLPSGGEETWGLVVNEAMMCGCPCIVSDRVGSGPDLVISGQTGETYPVGNVDELTRLFVEFALDKVKLQGMGKRAQELVAKYSVQTAVDGVIQALEVVKKI